jgi:adenylate cyclase class IV
MNKIELAFDEVKGLGYFLEAESIKNTGGVKKAYAELETFIKSLGIKEIKTVPGGYAAEMMRRKGLMKLN